MTDVLHAIEGQLRTPRLREALAPLFCETLNWGRAMEQAFSRSLTWRGETTRLVFSPISQLSKLPVFRVDWPHTRLPTSMQRRAVYQALQAAYVEHLLVYVTSDEKQAAFVWARRKAGRAENSQARVKTELRVLPFAVDSAARTTIEQLGKLAFTVDELGIFGDPGPSAVSSKLDAAFDVEAVTKEFFKAYGRIFEAAESALPAGVSAEQRRLYTQRFFNRLMFLAFLEHKSWMRFGARRDYLRALFEDYYRNQPDKRPSANFHRTRLNTLFFLGLSNQYDRNLLQTDPEFQLLRDQVGDVPYLNGGLFTKEADDEKWFFPDLVVVQLLRDLIYHFNFTVTESTPLDVEVAVDPEMLGKIFEKLVTGRHETGSYYTPKVVVAFMCRQALKGYLRATLPSETDEALSQFVEENDAGGLHNPELVLDALRLVRVCDPACGSGAYLLSMMHELLQERECLFAAKSLDTKTMYERKLEIIQDNLYGVDIDEFAVNIARLRLWLSLVVDDTRNPLDDPHVDVALPNLDFKIEPGDSLTAPEPSGGLKPDLIRYSQVQEYFRLKSHFMKPESEEKADLQKQIAELRDSIRAWAHPDSVEGFDWQVEFAEVFAPELAQSTFVGKMAQVVNRTPGQMEMAPESPEGGFDIVLANPPYVRADAQFKHIGGKTERKAAIANWRAYRERLKRSGIYTTLYEKWDLYVPFLERAYQLLRPNGQMVYIISDAYNAAKYAAHSHDFFLRATQVERIDFCSEINLFDAGVNNTIAHFAKRQAAADHRPQRVRRWGRYKEDFDENEELLPTGPQARLGQDTFRKASGHNRRRDDSIALEKICYITKGMVIHANERGHQGEFASQNVLSPTRDKAHPKRFVLGKDVMKWHLGHVRYLEWGTKRAPARFSRPTFPELQDAKKKLIAVRTPGAEPKVFYDDASLHFDASSVGLVPWHLLKGVVNRSISKTAKYVHQDPLGDRALREETSSKFDLKYVLAIMNSSYARKWLIGQRRSKVHVYPDDWKELPVPPIPEDEQKVFVELVERIISEFRDHGSPLPPASAQQVAKWEREIDERVASLYGLD